MTSHQCYNEKWWTMMNKNDAIWGPAVYVWGLNVLFMCKFEVYNYI